MIFLMMIKCVTLGDICLDSLRILVYKWRVDAQLYKLRHDNKVRLRGGRVESEESEKVQSRGRK